MEDTVLPFPLGGEFSLKRFQEQWRREQLVICPWCGHERHPGFEELEYLITFWGDDGWQEVECDVCEKTFLAKECVRRTYDSCKPGEENKF